MDRNINVEERADDHAVVGEHKIDVTNWKHYGKRQVRVSWPSIGATDLAAAKRFAAELQAAIEIAERYDDRNFRQQLVNEATRND